VPALDGIAGSSAELIAGKQTPIATPVGACELRGLGWFQANHVLLKITEQLSLVSRGLGVLCHPKCRRLPAINLRKS
jgi:hypothetical protein